MSCRFLHHFQFHLQRSLAGIQRRFLAGKGLRLGDGGIQLGAGVGQLVGGFGGEQAVIRGGDEREAAELAEVAAARHLFEAVRARRGGGCVDRLIEAALRQLGERAGLEIYEHRAVFVAAKLFDRAHRQQAARVRARAVDEPGKTVGVVVGDGG